MKMSMRLYMESYKSIEIFGRSGRFGRFDVEIGLGNRPIAQTERPNRPLDPPAYIGMATGSPWVAPSSLQIYSLDPLMKSFVLDL